jgi:hypothetical protein
VTSVRLWILILSLVSFASGTAIGLLMGGRWREPTVTPGPFADYERMLVAEFDLSQERARALRGILQEYHQDVEDLEAEHMNEYMSAIRRDLQELADRYETMIRDHVLPARQRPRFDRLCEARLVNPPRE